MRVPVEPALNMFATRLTAYDTTIALVDGRQQITVLADRIIFGVLVPAGTKFSALAESGAISAGDAILHTKNEVFIFDSYEDGRSDKQTYLKFANEQWKAVGIQNWAHTNPGITKYIMRKYQDINGNT